MDEMLHFKKPDEYPLKYFYQRNKIPQRDIARALGVSEGTLSDEFAGIRPMPAHFDRKLKATALHLSKYKKVRFLLWEKEEEFCNG